MDTHMDYYGGEHNLFGQEAALTKLRTVSPSQY
jgi:hypothetical protein